MATSVPRRSVSAHFNRGNLATGFLFSAPGAREWSEGRPVAGVTGENLDFALAHLHEKRPDLFPSARRYSYRITNAFSRPLAKSRGDRSSEAKLSQVIEVGNVARVKRELHGCNLVVLCGRRAQALSRMIAKPGRVLIDALHPGNRALAAKWPSGGSGT